MKISLDKTRLVGSMLAFVYVAGGAECIFAASP
jgi:hypothetical protein